jgi:transposase-like protein
MANKNKKYSPDQRNAILKRIEAHRKKGMSVKDACAKAGITDVTLYAWQGRTKASKGKPAVGLNPVTIVKHVPPKMVRMGPRELTIKVELVDTVALRGLLKALKALE